jgi:hypothetical protein
LRFFAKTVWIEWVLFPTIVYQSDTNEMYPSLSIDFGPWSAGVYWGAK